MTVVHPQEHCNDLRKGCNLVPPKDCMDDLRKDCTDDLRKDCTVDPPKDCTGDPPKDYTVDPRKGCTDCSTESDTGYQPVDEGIHL